MLDLDETAILMAAAFRASRAEPRRRDPDASLMAAISRMNAEQTLDELANPQRGVWPDGTRVTGSQKRALWERYEAVRDEYRRGERRRPVMASAGDPDGPGPLVAHLFGLD